MAFPAALVCGLSAAMVFANDAGGPAILERRCLVCHGPTTQMGGLNLSTREGALKGGEHGAALAPGEPGNSLLLARVMAEAMPPGTPLPAAEKEALRAWIAGGASWAGLIEERRAGRDWWSLQPLRETAAPASGDIADEWSDSVIDRWVFARLLENGLQPAPTADRRTLIRRLTFDLLGLPPTPAEIEEFSRDESPDAYEKLVDRLLASPHYGERWARHWLDVMRYAESEGFERDLMRDDAWRYRDYVIRSFNSDKSYLTFAREQLAGDVIEPVTHDGIVAAGMLVMGPVDAVGLTSALDTEREQIRQDQLEELVGAVSQTFIGLTVNCARCHDHKFDPITQKEFYRMKAAFEAVWHPARPNPEAGLDEFYPYGRPLMTPAELGRYEERVNSLERRIGEAEAKLGEAFRRARGEELTPGAPAPVARWTFDVDGRDDFQRLNTVLLEAAEIREGRLGVGAGEASTEKEKEAPKHGVAVSALLDRELGAKTLEAWVVVKELSKASLTLMQIHSQSGFRGAAVDGIELKGGDRPHWENYSIGQFRSQDAGGPVEEAAAGERIQIAISYERDGTIAIFRNGKPYGKPYTPDKSTAAGELQIFGEGDAVLRFPVSGALEVEEARLYDSALSAAEAAASYAAGIRNETREDLLAAMGPETREETVGLEQELRELRAELEAVEQPALALSPEIKPGKTTHVLIRGDVNQKGEEVAVGGLASINGPTAEFGLSARASDAERRRAMAEWIANPDNPLFSRVMVNRVWQHHFGDGFVANPSDFGFNGGVPSHPELLDYLALDFVRGDWSVKRLQKRMVMSAAYRQSSRFDEAAAAKDSGNRFLWRFSPRRLEAEEVRDAMLAVGGTLNQRMHGESFRPFELTKKGTMLRYDPLDSDDPEHLRRTIYRMNVTTGGHPLLEALDCPVPSVKTPKRPTTTTPLQALSLMNNVFVQKRAAEFAARVEREAADADGRIRRAFELAFGRAPRADEMAPSRRLVEQHGLVSLCWGIFNASEFLYVE